MRISRQRSGRNRRGNIARFFILLALPLALLVWADAAMRPAIENILAYQAKVYALRLLNEAMTAQIAQDGARYDKLVTVTRGDNGDVKSIEADMVEINRLKTNMSAAVITKLENSGNRDIAVPIGTMLGNQFTSGRGPKVTIKIVPTGYVQSEIFNQFSSAGINQTLHQVMLQMNVQMIAVLPGYSVKTETVTSFCIAETVIVGNIPQGFANFGGDTPTFAAVGK